MQLRVARLCLDCEEVFAGDSCPVCASERYAFLSRWLPSEERRRWRRPAPKRVSAAHGPVHAVKRLFARWLGDGDHEVSRGRLRTRASDFVPDLSFDEPAKEPAKKPARATEPLKGDVQ